MVRIFRAKEKARVVAPSQGFIQIPGQFDETYTPIPKMDSVRILLAWTAVRDLDIFQFDCKMAFLHAKIRHPIYARQVPGYPLADPKRALRLLTDFASRNLSFTCWYCHFSLTWVWFAARLTMVFYWRMDVFPWFVGLNAYWWWFLYVPINVDDGLAITNSPWPSPYALFLSSPLSKHLHNFEQLWFLEWMLRQESLAA